MNILRLTTLLFMSRLLSLNIVIFGNYATMVYGDALIQKSRGIPDFFFWGSKFQEGFHGRIEANVQLVTYNM